MGFVLGNKLKVELLALCTESQAPFKDSEQNRKVGTELSCQEIGAGREKMLQLCILPLYFLRASQKQYKSLPNALCHPSYLGSFRCDQIGSLCPLEA